MVHIDGSVIEGGGQIVRIAIGLSALFSKPIDLVNVLKDRAKEGLRAQHLTGLRLVKEITQAQVEGDILGSTSISFKPKGIKYGEYLADAGTAGSVCLLLQVSLPCILFGKGESKLTLKGGTNVPMAPQIDYVVNVFKPMLEKFGATFNCKIVRRGFYPAGNGQIEIDTSGPNELKSVELTDFGEVNYISGEAFVAGVLPFRMAEEMARTAENMLRKAVKTRINIKPIKFSQNEAFGNGSGINLVAVTTTGCYLGGSCLGERGVQSEEVGRKAAEELLDCITRKDCVDQYAQDQLIIFMALADGKSSVKTGPITSHTEKAIKVTEMFTDAKFTIKKLDNDCNIIECTGQGQNSH
ncbi:UNVERIFIED_CONTAM: hypothetical protein PYX00_000099 [Menopon gallinae]|uniref:RNA 3'-terminal phosphate cyclase n=1 Tax=Menopon gallinae TaxID=328185 RepID=A0AAW2I762_9NEOP